MTPRSQQPSASLAIVLVVIGLVALLINLLAAAPINQGPLSVVLAPIQQALTSAGRFIGDFFRSLGEVAALRERADALQRQVNDLNAEVTRLREFQAEAQQYRELLRFAQDNPSYTLIGADVIGFNDATLCKNFSPRGTSAGVCANVIASESSPFLRYLTLNVGERDGVRVGMPVVSGGGALVGRVGKVSYATAQVQLITDPASFINVRLVKSRATGTVSGSEEGILRLENVLQTEPLEVGDQIVTSGLGGLLPASLPVGVVEAIVSSDVEAQRTAIVRPAAALNRLERVLVVDWASPLQITPQPTPVIVSPVR
ncbi:MAG: rod shape-determining protein MreC [Thermoflexales bacterium]|nr:rod shape-determining protein MreC [Thermoflexales bacterium]